MFNKKVVRDVIRRISLIRSELSYGGVLIKSKDTGVLRKFYRKRTVIKLRDFKSWDDRFNGNELSLIKRVKTILSGLIGVYL